MLWHLLLFMNILWFLCLFLWTSSLPFGHVRVLNTVEMHGTIDANGLHSGHYRCTTL
jgi:hypothetical protein